MSAVIVTTRTLVMVVLIGFASLAQALEVREAYVRGLPPGQKNTAAFFTLHNDSTEPITIRAGSSDAAAKLEIHGHQHRDGMMQMRQQDSVVLAARETLKFAPGGLHLMLLDLRGPLRDGDQVEFSLRVNEADELVLRAPVISVLRMNQHH